MGALPFFEAMNSGVIAPMRVAAFTLAPEERSSFAIFDIIFISGPMQRRGAIALRRVDVDLLREQRTHRIPIALHSGIGKPGVAGSRKKHRHTKCADEGFHGGLLNRDLSRAIANAVQMHPGLVQDGEQDVGHGSGVLASHVQIAFDLAVGMAGQEDRHALVIMRIRIAERASVEDQ